jgi:hypothetical protein
MSTKQEEFDAVVKHLYTQGRPAKSSAGCYYRMETEAGILSCAVGCRIPDSVYNPQMDIGPDDHSGTGIINLVEHFNDVLPEEIIRYEEMFRELQSVHDGAKQEEDGTFDFDHLAARLSLIANAHGVVFTNPRPTEVEES